MSSLIKTHEVLVNGRPHVECYGLADAQDYVRLAANLGRTGMEIRRRPASALALDVEIASRLRQGWTQVTVKEFTARYEALGYRLDRSHDCRCTARYLDDGRTYPCCTAYPVNITNGRSAWNEDKGSADFAGLQKLRGEIFAVSRGAILEV